jgi:hypothetical protein
MPKATAQVTAGQDRERAAGSGRKAAKHSGKVDRRMGSHASAPALDAPVKAYQASQHALDKSTE